MDLAMEDYRQALRRIAVMLIALAGLADCVAGRPHPLRGFVIWLLRRAEAVAREFVIEELRISGASMPPAPIALGQGGPAEAMRLALCLRAMAAALTGLAEQVGRLVACLDVAARPAGGFSGAAPLHAGRARASHCRRASNPNRHRDPIRQASSDPDTS